MKIEEIARSIVDSAFAVHSELGPGLLESAYEACLRHELGLRGHQVAVQLTQPVTYRGLQLDVGYRLDLLVDETLIVELKTVDQIQPIHHAQLLTYLKLSRKTLGLLINFNVPLIKNGIKRVVLNHPNS
ncbi:GxxExxY protein [Haloferula sp. A504]|uniref:GxxExxY protein n=1 Tax=Haloferula sp. A504 TaxID=3373601 RepID=UPI0031C23996|nr:GxxExxY protein [Verrucomicrobiaceae bacterium E54]